MKEEKEAAEVVKDENDTLKDDVDKLKVVHLFVIPLLLLIPLFY